MKTNRKMSPAHPRRLFFSLVMLLLTGACVFAQKPAPYGPVPSAAQLQWHETGMYCLIHFGPDTYTDKEWGYGDEDPAIFNPSSFDARQIVGAAKAGGFKGIVLVAKHHDGFCLWPTKTTGHNISKSPWKNGKGDMVKEFRDACTELGMQFGLYCSPWDRNSPLYGTKAYVDMYREQIKELYTNYGPLFLSWHDGANGGDGYYGGAREKRTIDKTTYYGWDTTWALIRRLQSMAAIFGDAGPDIRWVGNEEGHAGETCWETYTPHGLEDGKAPANGYTKYWEAVEGHRDGKYWMPAECDVPLRRGWIYHSSDAGKSKSPYTLLDLYFKSVGRGAALDLGLSPDKRGLLSDEDVAILKEFGAVLEKTFRTNLLHGAVIRPSAIRQNNRLLYGPASLTDDDPYSYWAADDNVKNPELVIDFKKDIKFNIIKIRENIKLGQRIDSFSVYVMKGKSWEKVAGATSIGALRLIRLPQYHTASRIKIKIDSARACPAVSELGFYAEPVHLTAPVIWRDKSGRVHISTDGAVTAIRYTTNGKNPAATSAIYSGPFLFPEGGTVKAKPFNGLAAGDLSSKEFGLSKSDWKVIYPQGDDLSSLIDDNEQTVATLSAQSVPVTPGNSVTTVIDMGKSVTIRSFSFTPPQNNQLNGIADQYIFYVSSDNQNWQAAASGEFSNIAASRETQYIPLKKPVKGRYIKFSAVHLIEGGRALIAEIGVK